MFSRLYLKFFRLLYLLAIITIFILAIVPNYDLLPEVFSLSDKLNHTAAFFVLAGLAYAARFDHAYRYQIVFLIGYAFFIEVVQYFLPTRFFSLSDVVADAAGIGLFLLLNRWSGFRKEKAHV